jgi:hypothetical protein
MHARHTLFALALAAVSTTSGCGWNHLPNQEIIDLPRQLWDPVDVVPTVDGLYVRLSRAGGLALLRPGQEEARLVELGEGRVTEVAVGPDQRTLVTFVERDYCVGDSDDELDPDDCETETRTEISLISNAEVTAQLDVVGTYNAVSYAEDGRYAIAYLDLSRQVTLQGVTNLTSVVVLDLQTGDTTPVSVGFPAEQVLFADDPNGASKAMVLSDNAVAVVDLLQEQPTVETTFPLTLDPDRTVTPVGIDLTPDGRYALISVLGSADLYALDLQAQAINIVELASAPADMAVHGTADRTVLVYEQLAAVEVLDHQFFDVQHVQLEEPATDVLVGDDYAVLYHGAGGRDLYRLDLPSGDLTEFRLQEAPLEVALAPDPRFAVALTRAGGSVGGQALPGMEILDLEDERSDRFLLEGTGLGVAFSATESRLDALVLQDGIDYLYQLDLYSRDDTMIDLPAPPVAIGALPNGPFYITHADGLGMVSFLDPATGAVETVAGFGAFGLIDDIDPIAPEQEASR